MVFVIVAVFAAVFAIVLVLSMSFDSSGVQARKHTKERLDSISLAAKREPENEGVSLLREELLSSAPWLDQYLRRLDLFGGLRTRLSQADLKWNVVQVLTTS